MRYLIIGILETLLGIFWIIFEILTAPVLEDLQVSFDIYSGFIPYGPILVNVIFMIPILYILLGFTYRFDLKLVFLGAIMLFFDLVALAEEPFMIIVGYYMALLLFVYILSEGKEKKIDMPEFRTPIATLIKALLATGFTALLISTVVDLPWVYDFLLVLIAIAALAFPLSYLYLGKKHISLYLYLKHAEASRKGTSS